MCLLQTPCRHPSTRSARRPRGGSSHSRHSTRWTLLPRLQKTGSEKKKTSEPPNSSPLAHSQAGAGTAPRSAMWAEAQRLGQGEAATPRGPSGRLQGVAFACMGYSRHDREASVLGNNPGLLVRDESALCPVVIVSVSVRPHRKLHCEKERLPIARTLAKSVRTKRDASWASKSWVGGGRLTERVLVTRSPRRAIATRPNTAQSAELPATPLCGGCFSASTPIRSSTL